MNPAILKTIEVLGESLHEDPSQSVDQLMKVLDHQKLIRDRDLVSDFRRRFLAERALSQNVLPSGTPLPVMEIARVASNAASKCKLFGSYGHWASQCPSPPVVPSIQLPTPKPPEEPMNAPLTAAPRPRGMAARRQYLNELLDADPGIDPTILQGRIKERFGKGIGTPYLYDCCRVAREIHGLPQIPERFATEPRDMSERPAEGGGRGLCRLARRGVPVAGSAGGGRDEGPRPPGADADDRRWRGALDVRGARRGEGAPVRVQQHANQRHHGRKSNAHT